MWTIKIRETNKTISVADGENLMDALLLSGVFVDNPCNGKGTCGKCKVKIYNESYQKAETVEKLLTQEELEIGVRLSCNIKVTEDLEIDVLKKEKNIKIHTQGYMPDFKKEFREGYGIAVDIGTTTVVGELVNLEDGKVIDSGSTINPQKVFGLDVLTRITYEVEKGQDAIESLQEIIVAGINGIIEKLSRDNKIEKSEIKEIIIAANTTMAHFLLGVDARSLGKFPYHPAFVESKKVLAKSVGLKAGEETVLYTLPHVSAFVGADIVAGAYLAGFNHSKGNELFIDIGTNGEIVLGKNGKLYCCSCAAGPALEGMNISYGMRAEPGAIEDIEIQEDGAKLTVIGDEAPIGICGSGILAGIRELIKHKMIRENGALVKKDSIDEKDYRQQYILPNERKRDFLISKDPKILISQSDIRQVQLAKGAILSGIMTLLKAANIKAEDLDKVYVAGQFGAHLPAESLVITGIVPPEVFHKIDYLGNTSKSGAYMALMSSKVKGEMEDLSKKIEYIELAVTDSYEDIFRESLFYPVKVDFEKIKE